jgi:hypothetical protein
LQLRLENLLTAHLDELATVLLHPAVYQHIEDELPTLDEFKLRLERAIASPSVHYLVRDAAGAMLGRLEATCTIKWPKWLFSSARNIGDAVMPPLACPGSTTSG